MINTTTLRGKGRSLAITMRSITTTMREGRPTMMMVITQIEAMIGMRMRTTQTIPQSTQIKDTTTITTKMTEETTTREDITRAITRRVLSLLTKRRTSSTQDPVPQI